jgi:hypothetical protein
VYQNFLHSLQDRSSSNWHEDMMSQLWVILRKYCGGHAAGHESFKLRSL